MSQTDREQRRLMRQRGAGNRVLQHAEFAFSFAGLGAVGAGTPAAPAGPPSPSVGSSGGGSPSPLAADATAQRPPATPPLPSAEERSQSSSPGPEPEPSPSPLAHRPRRTTRSAVSAASPDPVVDVPVPSESDPNEDDLDEDFDAHSDAQPEKGGPPSPASPLSSPPADPPTHRRSHPLTSTPAGGGLRLRTASSASPSHPDPAAADASPSPPLDSDTIMRNSSASPIKSSRFLDSPTDEDDFPTAAGPDGLDDGLDRPSSRPPARRQGVPLTGPARTLPRPSTIPDERKRRALSLPEPVQKQQKRTRRAPTAPTAPVEDDEQDRLSSSSSEPDDDNHNDDGPDDPAIVKIASFRPRADGPDYQARRQITAVEVIAQVAAEVCDRAIATTEQQHQPPSLAASSTSSSTTTTAAARAAALRKTSYIKQLGAAIQGSLLDLAETDLAGAALERRVATARAGLAAKRRHLLATRRAVARATLDLDALRAGHVAAAGRAHALRELAEGWEGVAGSVAAAARSADRHGGRKRPAKAEDGQLEDVVSRVQRVSSQVSGTKSGLLGRLQAFNGLLEGTLQALDE